MIKFRLEPEAHQCRLEQLRVHAKHDKRNSRLICTKRTAQKQFTRLRKTAQKCYEQYIKSVFVSF